MNYITHFLELTYYLRVYSKCVYIHKSYKGDGKMERKIKKYIEGVKTKDGAGVKLRRVFGNSEVPLLDPFLMMDFFDSTDSDDYIKGFPWHPHRGIETVTYLISGKIEHGDSIGNEGTINDGDCQWMTAGSGILHQEMPKPSKKMLGTQIWLNLPKKNKMTEPKYRDIRSDIIPVYEEEGKRIHIIAGKYKDKKGPLEVIDTDPTFFDIEMDENREFTLETNPNYKVFAFLVEGGANFNVEGEEFINAPMGILYEEGSKIKVNTRDKKARFFLLMGKPLNEPVAWGGPIVMNTQEELDLAFRELKEEKFIK